MRDLLRQMLRDPALIVWALLVFFIPFYLGQSGLPQPGNLLIFPLVPLAFRGWNGVLDLQKTRAVRWLMLFTLWVCIVDLVWTIALGAWAPNESSCVIYAFYYVYNLLVFVAFLLLHRRHGDLFLRITLYVISASVLMQVVVSMSRNNTAQVRDELFFNNPNQLGFFALLAACTITVCERRLRIGLWKVSAVLLGCAYLAFISASRAAVGSIGILFFLQVFSNPRIVVIASLGALALVSFGTPISHAIDMTEQRIEYRRNEDLVAHRGYDRLWKYPEYLVLGAGEGHTQRFVQDERLAYEIHSSFATVAFSYGVLGVILFGGFLWIVIRGASMRAAFMIVPALAYSATHQGLRSSMLWILFAVFLVLKRTAIRRLGTA